MAYVNQNITPQSKVSSFDADGIPDYRDLDSDNDGLPDSVEVRYQGSSSVSESSSELIKDILQSRASVTSLAADRMSLQDQDNDGTNDLIESGGVDSNNDGIVDSAAIGP